MITLIQINDNKEFNDVEKLIYDIIYLQKRIFNIDLEKYCSFENRAIFREELRTIIYRGGLKILDDRIIHTNETVIWKLELKQKYDKTN